MRTILFLITYCSLVYGDCQFPREEHGKEIQTKMKNWKIYGKIFNIANNGLKYSIGICSTVNNSVNSSAIIQQENNMSYVLGRLDQVNLIGGDNWILLTYGNGESYTNMCSNSTRSASIMFICGQNMNNLTIIQEHTQTHQSCNYMFQIQVPELCPTVQKNPKISGGGIFLIILFSLAIIYLIVGAVYMHVKHGARGLDHIPNLEMWRRLGHSAADGCDFCCRCERVRPRTGYFMDESGPDLRGDDDILSP